MLLVQVVEDYFDIHYNMQAIAPAAEVIIKRTNEVKAKGQVL